VAEHRAVHRAVVRAARDRAVSVRPAQALAAKDNGRADPAATRAVRVIRTAPIRE